MRDLSIVASKSKSFKSIQYGPLRFVGAGRSVLPKPKLSAARSTAYASLSMVSEEFRDNGKNVEAHP